MTKKHTTRTGSYYSAGTSIDISAPADASISWARHVIPQLTDHPTPRIAGYITHHDILTIKHAGLTISICTPQSAELLPTVLNGSTPRTALTFINASTGHRFTR